MNDQEGRAYPKGAIPKRPSQQPEQLPSPPKQASILPKRPRPIPIHINEQDGQSPILPIPSSEQLDELDNRILFSEMATVKRDALRAEVSPERKSIQIPYPAIVMKRSSQAETAPEKKISQTPYPAMVTNRRMKKRGLLAWVTSLAFLK